MSDDPGRIRPIITNPNLRVRSLGTNDLRLRPDGRVDQVLTRPRPDGTVERITRTIEAPELAETLKKSVEK